MGVLSSLIKARKAAEAKPVSTERMSIMGQKTIDLYKPDNLIDLVHRYDRVDSDSRFGLPSHVSQLIDCCPRQLVLMALQGKGHLSSPSGWTRIIWALGRAAEAHMRGVFIRAAKDGRLRMYGHWRCPCKHTEREGFYKKKECSRCGMDTDLYFELALLNKRRDIIGSPDCVFFDDQDEAVPVEIKSIVKSGFNELRAPTATHLVQNLAYRKLLRYNDFNVSHSVINVYVAKQSSPRVPPYKQFITNVEEKRANSRAMVLQRELFAAGKLVGNGVKKRILPPRELCANPSCPRARNCPVASSCFNLTETQI